MKCPYIVGKKIYLRPLNIEDLKKGYLYWINNPEVNTFIMAARVPTPYVKLKEYYEKVTASHNDVMFAIVIKKTDKYIGNIKLGNIDWINRSAEVGRFIGEKRYWSKGYGTEALKLLMDYAFNTLNLNRICNRIVIDNIASIKSCEKLGMKKEGVFPQFGFVDGEYKDAVQLSMTKDSYKKIKNRVQKSAKR